MQITSGSPRRVAIVSNWDFYLYRFRVGLVRALVAQGVEVYTIAPPGPYVSQIEQAGAMFLPWAFNRRSLNPWRELRSLLSLARIYRSIRPTIVHHYTIKPTIYGPLAARQAGLPVVVASFMGLGYVFTEDGWQVAALRRLVSLLCRFAFRLSDAVTFENRDDIDYLRWLKILPPGKAHYIPGSVDMTFFDPSRVDGDTVHRLRGSLGLSLNGPIVLLVARMLWPKGVAEYVESARMLKAKHPDVHFLLVGPVDNGNPAGIPSEQLAEWHEAGWVLYLAERDDVRELLALADVVVLPYL